MPRSVNAVASRARRKKVLKLAKGNFGSRGNVWTVAKNTVEKGLTYAYRDRKNKKRQYPQPVDSAYQRRRSYLRNDLFGIYGQSQRQRNRTQRKVLADLAMNHPKAFEKVVKTVNK